MLSTASAILSMAAGGLYMAKGAMDLRCCSSGASGCRDNSAAATNTQQNLQQQTQQNANQQIPQAGGNVPNSPPGGSTITGRPNGTNRQPIDFFKLRFPDEAGNCPKKIPLSPPSIFHLFELFSPPPARAGFSDCLGALITLATGGMMLLNGLLGMQAANRSGQLADSSTGNMGNMATLPEKTSAEKRVSKLGDSSGNSSGIKLDPALLRTGRANEIMGQFEKKFGIGRDQFAKAIMDGEDPRKILNSAPKNPLSKADMNKATSSARNLSDADKAKGMADSGLADAQKELASKLGSDAYAINYGGGPSSSAASKSRSFEELPLDEAPKNPQPAAAASEQLSPEVREALAEKEKQDRANGITDMTIFQVVHLKYRERCKMILGYDPEGSAGKGKESEKGNGL